MEIAAAHLEGCIERDELDYKQFQDVALKLRNEATRLKAKAQEVRRGQ